MSGLTLNEDCNHFFVNRRHMVLGPSEVDAWVDQYAGTQISELVLNVNAMRTSYASQVWEPWWHGYDPEGGDDQPFLADVSPAARKTTREWIHTAWALHRDGIDLYKRWIARCRANGLKARLSMRMNDVHSVNEELHPMHSSFWRDRPELRRVPYKFTGWTDKALDYGQREVREYAFSLIQEMMERYDADGLELDWMRFGYHFRPGYEQEGTGILTAFTEDVRALLNMWEAKRGHRISLSARVPSRPQTALQLGMDAVTWARRGLVDKIIITPFWATIETDMPIEIWKGLLEGTGVQLAAGLEVLIRAYPASALRQTNSLETVRGAATSLLSRGADEIYLFNYMDSDTTIEDVQDYPRLIREVGFPETMAAKPRRHVVTYPDTWAPGETPAFALPVSCVSGGHAALRVHIGPKPTRSEYAEVRLGVGVNDKLEPASLRLLLNGLDCGLIGPVELPKPRPEGAVYAFEVPADAVRDGFNVIDLLPAAEFTVLWTELAIKPIRDEASGDN